MGTIFKKSYTKPLPPAPEIITRKGTRLARWRDAKGKVRTAPITTGRDGTERIRCESSTYYARYRNGDRLVVEESTGCRDETAARQVLADWERRAERMRAGVVTPTEARVANHVSSPISGHVEAYLNSLEASGMTAKHIRETRRILTSVLQGCAFQTLADLDREAVEIWLVQRRSLKASARTRNVDLTALIAFVNWCIANHRLSANPFKGIPKANEAADPRRRRRAMTEDELARLLDVARHRPLIEASTIRRGKRKGKCDAEVRPEVRDRLEVLGRERALLYKTLVLTGLRKGELASLTVAQLKLDGSLPHVELDAADEKNREGNDVVIRPDLAMDLRHWLDDKLALLQADARRRREPVPGRLPSDLPVFYVPTGLVRIFDRDLKAAGIAKRDERDRTLDVHALRTTFGTLLSKGGVPLRTAQAAMRHSDPSLTANVYTDPKLLDVHGALDALPRLPLDSGQNSMRKPSRAVATGTYGRSPLAPLLAGNPDKPSQSGPNPDKTQADALNSIEAAPLVASGQFVKGSDTQTSSDNASPKWAMRDSNPRLPACKAGALTN
jgi:integrase